MRRVFPAILCLCGLSSTAWAQQAEQYHARLLSGHAVTSLSPVDPGYSELDDTPLGVDLSGIVILDDADDVHATADASGVVVRADNPNLIDPAFATALSPFLERPLSQRLLGQIRAAIIDYMRAQDRPLVAVVVPPQEITSGAVQFVVIPFVVGNVRVERLATGYEETSGDRVLESVRAQPGEEVNSQELLEDLAVLNVNPFRRVGVVFAPGNGVGETDIILRLADDKPWQVFGGYNNNGTQATGYDRLFVGGVWANSGGHDEQLSYQFTASPNMIISSGGPFDFSQDKAFMSNSAAALIPLPWRHKLTLRGDYVHSRADLAGPFVQDSQTGQISLEYGIPWLVGSPSAEIFVGAEAKSQRTELDFGGVPLGAGYIDVIQGFAGVRGHVDLAGTSNDFGLKGYFSPGGLTANNTDAAYVAASGFAGASATYAYLQASLQNITPLPLDTRLEFELAGQVATSALPSLEQLGIGGIDTVRGYETNERAGDHGFYAQAEFHLPTFSALEAAGIRDREDVYAFTDFGVVYDIADGTSSTLLGAGLGIDVAINDYVNASLAWGHTFLPGSTSAAGSDRIHLSIAGSF